MATYTGITQTKSSFGKIWFAVAAFAVAAALVIALVAMQGGPKASISPGTRPANTQPSGDTTSGGSRISWNAPQRF